MMKTRRINILNIFVLIMLMFVSKVMCDISFIIDKGYIYVSMLSFAFVIYQLIVLKRCFDVDIISTISIFVILLHVFNFGNFYLKTFGKEEFYIFFKDWFADDLFNKVKVGFWAICIIQALFSGICIYLSKGERAFVDYRRFEGRSDSEKRKAIQFCGLVMFILSFPCRVYWDVNQIVLGQVSGYVGGFSQVGLIDDIAFLFAPSLICLMYAKKKNKKFCLRVFLFYVLYTTVVMTLSGARRAYITSLIAVFVFYYESFLKNSDGNAGKKKHGVLFYFTIVIIAMILLNFLTIVRDYRHSVMLMNTGMAGQWSDLFSLDFIWDVFGEFGLTGIPLYYAHQYFITEIPCYYGLNLLLSIVFILPIGWMFNYTFVTTRLMDQIHFNGLYMNTGLGSSILCELYGDFGRITPLFAVIAGYVLASFCTTNSKGNDDTSIKMVTRYCLSIVIINYVRGSTSEVFRNGGYVIIFIYMLTMLYFSINKQSLTK